MERGGDDVTLDEVFALKEGEDGQDQTIKDGEEVQRIKDVESATKDAETIRAILDTPRTPMTSYELIGETMVEMPMQVVTRLGPAAESNRLLARGRMVDLAESAVTCLSSGERLAFLEIFSGKGMLTLGARAHGLKVIDGWDRDSPFGSKRWDLTKASDQNDCIKLVNHVDPVLVEQASGAARV